MPISALVVDDTVTYRKIVSDILSELPEIAAVATAPSGALALKKMAQSPFPLVFLDVHMPDMDGVETLKKIRAEFPQACVVMISGVTTRSADTTIEALQLGAIDFIRKPDGADHEKNRQQLTSDIKTVVRLVILKLQTQRILAPGSPAAPSVTEAGPKPVGTIAVAPATFSIAAIGVSTGGPEALGKVIPRLPADLPVPVLVVQHMPPLFTKSLADSLAKRSALPVVEAENGEQVRPGKVYLAPGGRHMVVRNNGSGVCIGINDEPPENSCRPSVDVLFRSVASAYEDKGILAVVMTGMGCDGLNGVRALKRRGCVCLTQTEGTCVVYGMPRSIDEARLSDRSVPLDTIAAEIARIASRR